MLTVPRLAVPAAALAMLLASTSPAFAAQPPVGLGTATSFAVLAGTAVTNTGPSTISGDVGVSPGTAVTGFPPGTVNNGTIHAADAVAQQAEDDLTTAYDDAAGRTPVVDKTGQDLGGQTLVAGVYQASSAMALTGTVTLDAQGDPDAIFIFQAGSTLITASSSSVALIGDAQACNVYWQVGSSATLGTASSFVGTVMALTSISLQTGATVQGRMLARNGQVSLDTNTITRPTCAAATATPTPTTNPTATASPSPGGGGTTSPGGGDSTTPGAHSTSTPGSGTSTGPVPSGGASGPVIPFGHPHTGRTDAGTRDANLWLVLAALSLGGAGAAAVRSARRSETSSHRRS